MLNISFFYFSALTTECMEDTEIFNFFLFISVFSVPSVVKNQSPATLIYLIEPQELTYEPTVENEKRFGI
jgi:hypothetical protein